GQRKPAPRLKKPRESKDIVLPAAAAACYQDARAGRGLRERERMAKNGAIKLVAGNSNPRLAEAIAAYLSIPMTQAAVRRFADMEIFVEIQENVRGADVFVVQST